ncbi:hypothetical protein BGX34_007196 [Mortierella sp. NVP85]|nr:hypothetical protein BGX34_007196 [Mortierella sp. NVP85]
MAGSKVVFVGNIPYEQTEEQLIEIFSEVGPVISFRLVFERETGKPRGYGFCEYHDERTAASAVRNLNGREIGNRSLKVDFAETDPARNSGRDQEDGPHARNSGSGAGPPLVMPPHLQQPPFMPPPGVPARLDPRIANNPGGAPTHQPNHLPISHPPPPMPPPPMPGTNSADAISAVLATMTPQDVFGLVSSMKVLGASEPERAKTVLHEYPHLAYALFQVLLIMNLVEPSSLQRMFPANPGPPPAASAAHQQLPPPLPGIPPPSHLGMPLPPHLQQQQPQFAPPGYPDQKALVAQVLALTPADIASLPEDQRANILQLRAQLLAAM